jgi:hypothetical protein
VTCAFVWGSGKRAGAADGARVVGQAHPTGPSSSQPGEIHSARLRRSGSLQYVHPVDFISLALALVLGR